MSAPARDRLLLVCDFAVHSGFAKVGESLAQRLKNHHGWDIHVLALNYYGDPHPLQQEHHLYPPSLGGRDSMGFGRIADLVRSIRPKAIMIVNDPWVSPFYIKELVNLKGCPPLVLYCPVDGPNLRSKYVYPLNAASRVVAYTEFGREELRKAKLEVPCEVIPHGIDLSVFYPVDKTEAREQLDIAKDDYVVLWADRNSIRKRPDHAIEIFAKWVHSKNLPPNVKLFMYTAMEDIGYDLPHLAAYWGVDDRLIVTDAHESWGHGFPQEMMKVVYSTADVKLSTTMGEGWGLCVAEAMACGVPNIVPRWSALAEWPAGAVEYVPINHTLACYNRVNHLGGISDTGQAVGALDRLYGDPARRAYLSDKGLRLVRQTKFSWDGIAAQFDATLRAAMADGRGPDRPPPGMLRNTPPAGEGFDAQLAPQGSVAG